MRENPNNETGSRRGRQARETPGGNVSVLERPRRLFWPWVGVVFGIWVVEMRKL